MKTNVRDSSIESHYINQAIMVYEAKRDQIEAYLLGQTWVTRRMIASATGIETATVSGEVNRMIKDKTLIETPDDDLRPCPISGRRVHWVAHKDRVHGSQQDLFGGSLQ